jgi:hypothetical protein
MRFISLLLLLPICLQAADRVSRHCYVSNCRTDADGTVWCDNQQVNCCDVDAMNCQIAPDTAADASQTALECSTPTGRTLDVLVTAEREPASQPMRTYRRRGIGGFGADGGEFEKYTIQSSSHSWPDFDAADAYDYGDPEEYYY